jgi:hypothetical protein
VAALDHACDGVEPVEETVLQDLLWKVLVDPKVGGGFGRGWLDVGLSGLEGGFLSVVPGDEGIDARLICVVHAHQLLGRLLKSEVKIFRVREGHHYRLR